MRLEQLGRRSFRSRRVVLALWLVALVGAHALAGVVGGDVANNFSNPGAESQEAFDILRTGFPEQAGDRAVIVLRAEQGVADAEVRRRSEDLFDAVAVLDHVTSVSSPFDTGQISADGRTATAVVQFDQRGPDLPADLVPTMKRLAQEAAGDDLQVELGGDPVRVAEQAPPGGREGVGLAASAVILLLLFGSVVATSLPILTAGVGIGTGIGLVSLLARFVDIPVFAIPLAAMLGLGVGIDYSLFIVTRYRAVVGEGLTHENAAALTVATAGRAVVVASLTVVISLLGMFLMGISFVYGLALAASITVLCTMVAAVTLLPAVLGFAGPNVNRLRLRVPLRQRHPADTNGAWYRWSRVVQRHPVVAATAGFAVLLSMAVPALALRLGPIDTHTSPPSSTARRAYDLISEGFGPGFNAPLALVAELPTPPRPDGLDSLELLRQRLSELDGVALVTPPTLSPSGALAVMTAYPTTGPSDEQTNALVAHLREEVIPATLAGTGTVVHVGGLTAAFIDLADVLADRLPLFIGAVVALSFLLLMLVFRSLLVPLKAALMNVLSVGVAYGAVVAAFQWGWLSDVVGIDRTGPIPSFLPMTLFAVLFGLSMDYEVFLLSRIREEYLRTGDNRAAVADGLAATGRVVTAAAGIMVTVFASFVLGDDRIIQILGLGLAVAVMVDATVVRMVLVPATMELLGRANWWLPPRLARALPHLDVEGSRVPRRVEPAELSTALRLSPEGRA